MPENQTAVEVTSAPAPEPTFREQVEQAEKVEGLSPDTPLTSPAAENIQRDPQPVEESEPDPAKEKVTMVPHQALHAERERGKQARAELEQMRRNFAALQAQQAEILQTLQQQNARQQPLPPDPVADPLGRGMYETAELRKQVEDLARVHKQTIEQQQQERQAQQFVANVRAADAEFHTRQPDSHEAFNYLKRTKQAEYEAGGMSAAEAQQRILYDEAQLCASAMQRGENPAEVVYNIAKAAGYTPATEKLAMQAAGQKATAPTGGQGNRGGGRLSLDALLKLTGDDFLKATEGNKWRKLAGG